MIENDVTTMQLKHRIYTTLWRLHRIVEKCNGDNVETHNVLVDMNAVIQRAGTDIYSLQSLPSNRYDDGDVVRMLTVRPQRTITL